MNKTLSCFMRTSSITLRINTAIIATEALDRIGALHDIERAITCQSPEVQPALRQANSGPKIAAFKQWSEEQLRHISSKSDFVKA